MADELKETSEGSTPAGIDDTKPSNNTAVSSLTPTSTVSKGIKKARDGSHGLKFESKLLPLFCIRGLGAGYKFELGKENENLAGTFNDVIFRYEVADQTTDRKHWRYLYLQAKHKENKDERKITANDLLDPNDKGPFSLKKYFLSYCKMRVRGDDVRDCIMCTNWGVNEREFNIIKLEKVTEPHDILTFASKKISVKIYKLQIDKVLHVKTLKLLGVSDIEALGVTDSFNFNTLMVHFTFREKNSSEDQVFSVDLVMEKVIESKTKKFHLNFLNDENLSVGAQKFRQKICEVINDFSNKFILVVDMPNEIQFKKIIETEDISKYYQSNQCENQTIRIIYKISSAFEGKPAEFWLTSEEGKKILLAGVTDVSLEYQGKLKKKVGFNDIAIEVMKNKLRQLMDSPGNSKVKRIFAPSPQFTAVKVISAIQVLMRELEQEGNYFVVSSSLLQDEEKMKRWKNILKLQKGFHHFLVVVCDNEASAQNFENLFVDHQDENNFGIIISRGENEKEEEIKYNDLTEDFQNKILSKIVSLFQEEEKTLTVRDLVGDKPEEVIDFRSIEELLSEEKEIKIPSFNTSTSELYIKRKLRFPFDRQFEIGSKCKINPDGHIEWFVEEKERKGVWQKIKNEITNRASYTHIIVEDSDLINTGKPVDENQLMNSIENKEKERSVVIISGLPGSGKSTILSSYCKEIKKVKPDHWVIRINFVDHYESILKMGILTRSNAVDFLVNQLNVLEDQSLFSRSLLRIRLETGNRIVFLFDGFDEINDQCQEKAIQLMKVITEEKSIPLYVTTRTHMLDKLQFAFSTHKIVDDSDLMKEKSIVIISEVAGSGKSTILSHFYNEIRKMKPDHWVIRINLLDRFEEFKKLDKVENLEDAVDFLVNQLHVVDEKSSFSRSLLKNRLQTGDRIVFMFDGFEEISFLSQEKTIQLIKAITKEKLIQLYVTTRPPIIFEFDRLQLQFELSHLAYSFEKFTEEDQNNFLVSYWKKEFNLSDEYILQKFAASLVKRVSETLNDEEKTFFGIPLQCRILAINFQSNVSELIKKGWTKHEEELLRKQISVVLDNHKFDCVSLFERLMKEKSRIFREKAKAVDNDIQKSAIKSKIKAIKNHLTRLAIETIVTDQKFSELEFWSDKDVADEEKDAAVKIEEITKVLWPPQSLHRSDKDLAKEEKDIASNGLKFGLTIKIGEKIQFLHRTIAEYLFASFLYKGFLLDDKQHNKLLENESIRRLILEEILVKWKYRGVQEFFNGMLKKIVDDDEKWRNINTRQLLPDRLKNVIDFFCKPVQPADKIPNALQYSLENGNIKIFTFLCDCLDSTLDETQIETVMMKCFINDCNDFSFQCFRTTESKIFGRFIGYLKNNTLEVLEKLNPCFAFNSLDSIFPLPSPSKNSEYFHWNEQEQKIKVDILVQLIEKAIIQEKKDMSRYVKKRLYDADDPDDTVSRVSEHMLSFLLFHDNYESLLILLIRVLAQEMDDSNFAELLKKLFRLENKHSIISGRIEKVLLATLRDLKKNQILIEMRRTVLIIEPEVFQRFYLPVVEGKDVTSMDLNMLMERDLYGMTLFHRAAFYGDTKEIDKIFEKLGKCQDKETKQMMTEIMIRDENGVTPFYIVALRGHEEMYIKMLTFLKTNFSFCIQGHLTCRYRFELLSLYDAVKSENIEMFQMILKAVKKESGSLEFIQILCRPVEFCFEIYGFTNREINFYRKIIFHRFNCRDNEYGNAMVKIAVTRDDGAKDYTDLYDLIFHYKKTEKLLPYIDAEDLQGLLSLKGVANFTKQIVNNAHWSQEYLLENFTKDQLEQLVDTITSKNEAKIAILGDESSFTKIFHFLKKRELGDDRLKNILLSEDEKGFIMTRLPTEDVKRMLTCLSEERQEEVKQEWKNNVPAMHTFFSSTDLQLNDEFLTACYWHNILMFYLEYGSQENLTEFVEIVTVLRKVDDETCTSLLSLISSYDNTRILSIYHDNPRTYEIFKLALGVLGPDAVKRMMIHEIDLKFFFEIDEKLLVNLEPKNNKAQINKKEKIIIIKGVPLIIEAMLLGKDIDKWLEILPQKIREEIREFMNLYPPMFIDEAFSEPQIRNPMQKLIYYIRYIWRLEVCQHQGKLKDFSKICYSEAAKKLMLHDYHANPVIFYFAKKGEEMWLWAIFLFLSEELRKRIEKKLRCEAFENESELV